MSNLLWSLWDPWRQGLLANVRGPQVLEIAPLNSHREEYIWSGAGLTNPTSTTTVLETRSKATLILFIFVKLLSF